MSKEHLFSSKRNIKAITEEILYFLFDHLGFANRFLHWPPVDKSSVNEFKLTTFKILEELKHTNQSFKYCPISIRKSLLDEYSGSASAERIDDLFYFLSCLVVEQKFSQEINQILKGNSKNPVVFLKDLQRECFELTDTLGTLEFDWSQAIANEKSRLEHFLLQESELASQVSLQIQKFQGLNLEELLQAKVQSIEQLIQESKNLHSQIQSCILHHSPNVVHLRRLMSEEMNFSLVKIENFFRQRYGKEFFCLSFEHKGLALDLEKILQFLMQKNKETLEEISSVSIEEFTQQSQAIGENIQSTQDKLEKLVNLREKLSMELEECTAKWNNLKADFGESKFHFDLNWPSFDFSVNLLNVERGEIVQQNSLHAPFTFEKAQKTPENHKEVTTSFQVESLLNSPQKNQQESEEEDIDAKYIPIPRSPNSSSSGSLQKKITTPKSGGKSRSLLKSVIKSQIGFKERLEMIKKKYQNIPNPKFSDSTEETSLTEGKNSPFLIDDNQHVNSQRKENDSERQIPLKSPFFISPSSLPPPNDSQRQNHAFKYSPKKINDSLFGSPTSNSKRQRSDKEIFKSPTKKSPLSPSKNAFHSHKLKHSSSQSLLDDEPIPTGLFIFK